jgi:hypothetical protein
MQEEKNAHLDQQSEMIHLPDHTWSGNQPNPFPGGKSWLLRNLGRPEDDNMARFGAV